MPPALARCAALQRLAFAEDPSGRLLGESSGIAEHLERALLGPVAVQLEPHLLQVEHDLGRVLERPRDG